MSAFIYSKYGFLPGVDTIKGLFHVIGKDDLYYKAMSSGALQSSLVSMDRDYLQGNLRDLLEKSAKDKTLNILKNPLETLRALSEFFGRSYKLESSLKGLQRRCNFRRDKEGCFIHTRSCFGLFEKRSSFQTDEPTCCVLQCHASRAR